MYHNVGLVLQSFSRNVQERDGPTGTGSKTWFGCTWYPTMTDQVS